MANQAVFGSGEVARVRGADARNLAGGRAYRRDARQALAQVAMTGCLGRTFYASEQAQVDLVRELVGQVDTGYVARLAVYARERGLMKDMPALLCAELAVRDVEALGVVFDRVITNGKMLRNFVQIVRSGVTGRRSLGSAPKRLVQRWITRRSDRALLNDSVGQNPSLGDVVRMVHPKPMDDARRALYAYLIGKGCDLEQAPQVVRELEAFRAGRCDEVPRVEFRLLTSGPLAPQQWRAIAEAAPWQMTRMNLNTFLRHGVFGDPALVRRVAQRLADHDAVRAAGVFPYQLLAAYRNVDASMPRPIVEALHDAMEVAVGTIPSIGGSVVVCPDVSGSMRTSVTGERRGASSQVRCVDVAALVAAVVLRRNPDAKVLPFEGCVVDGVGVDARDTVMTTAERLSSIGGGATDCSAPLRRLNEEKARVDAVWFVSDYESWSCPSSYRYGRGTPFLVEWERLRRRNPGARLVCVDVTPKDTAQAYDRADVLNVGGFSDTVFSVAGRFLAGELEAGLWVGEIERVDLAALGNPVA